MHGGINISKRIASSVTYIEDVCVFVFLHVQTQARACHQQTLKTYMHTLTPAVYTHYIHRQCTHTIIQYTHAAYTHHVHTQCTHNIYTHSVHTQCTHDMQHMYVKVIQETSLLSMQSLYFCFTINVASYFCSCQFQLKGLNVAQYLQSSLYYNFHWSRALLEHKLSALLEQLEVRVPIELFSVCQLINYPN